MCPYHMADCCFDDNTYFDSETVVPETFWWPPFYQAIKICTFIVRTLSCFMCFSSRSHKGHVSAVPVSIHYTGKMRFQSGKFGTLFFEIWNFWASISGWISEPSGSWLVNFRQHLVKSGQESPVSPSSWGWPVLHFKCSALGGRSRCSMEGEQTRI